MGLLGSPSWRGGLGLIDEARLAPPMGLPVKLRVAYGLWTALSTLRNFINASAWPGVRLRVHPVTLALGASPQGARFHGSPGGGSRVGTWETNPSQPTTAFLNPCFHIYDWPRDPMRSTLEKRNNPRRDGHNPSPRLGPPDQNRTARSGGGSLERAVFEVRQWGEGPRPRCKARGRAATADCQYYTQYHRGTPMPMLASRG